MSDKKMNDFPTAADGAFVYAEDANGNQIKISKADLASVVAELLKTNKDFIQKMAYMVQITGVTNANDIKAGHFAYISNANNVLNMPLNSTQGYLYCFGLENGYRVQFYIEYSGTPYCVRNYIFDAWGNWKEL